MCLKTGGNLEGELNLPSTGCSWVYVHLGFSVLWHPVNPPKKQEWTIHIWYKLSDILT